MAAVDGAATGVQDQQQQPPARAVERLNTAVQQQLNLESVRTRANSLYKAISRILEEFDAISRANAVPKWQDVVSQFSMVNLELFNIVEDIKNVSKSFVVHPRNVNAENATILPVMLSSKLLPEMEIDDNTKREQLLQSMQNMPVSAQIEKLKARIDMIGAACESAEKMIADTRKAYFGTRQGPTILPTIDKVQAAKIQEQENLLRSAVNHGEGLRISGDQRQITSTLPVHLVDVFAANDGPQNYSDASGMYLKNTPPLSSTSNNSQGNVLQASGAQLLGRSAASPSGATVNTSFDNTTASPLQYANSPRSSANMMNTPSPQQQSLQQLQQQQLQRQKMTPQHQQLLAQQQFRQSSMNMGQSQLAQLHDMQGQGQQKFQQVISHQHMQFSQPLAAQQLQARQLASGAMHMNQNQMTQGNQLSRQLNQFSSPANNAMFNSAQTTPSQTISNVSAMMSSQPLFTRTQFGMSGGNRNLPSQNLSDQMFNMGAANSGGMMPIHQQQQHNSQGAFGNMQQSGQNLQPNMVQMQNTAQNHPNFQQSRPQNQQ
ncbi:mediator of RNA polymerase II transcription subunit 8 isoform X1 [Olea europaea subsp. europaea]|uniref:Mediator of RNA polymerase II transcription subunit 8 isoform X1 n=1 Tax=Olea europaea subsp. europaea TaxID=158383 RepID=A0A8S0UTJ9_OLEEU|nr:mediator of RNA polymerase II transcription subunit 8 isoform X1 [Olea europaea subsp. europaea]